MKRTSSSTLLEPGSGISNCATFSSRDCGRGSLHRLLRLGFAACALVAATAQVTSADPASNTAVEMPRPDAANAADPSTECVTNCLRSVAIHLTGHDADTGVLVAGSVRVEDENGRPVPLTQVTIVWRRPNGSGALFVTNTDSRGVASFGTGGPPGTYTLTVRNLEREGYEFDVNDSVLRKSITVLTGTDVTV